MLQYHDTTRNFIKEKIGIGNDYSIRSLLFLSLFVFNWIIYASCSDGKSQAIAQPLAMISGTNLDTRP